ncbi:MAG: hypothetical protein ACLGH3_02375 [Actinomycetota bacterium]
MRRLIPLLTLSMILTGCFFARDRVDGGSVPSSSTKPVAGGSFDPATATATLTIGTDVVRGVVARWCARGACETVAGARPAGRIVTSEVPAVVTVALEREPIAVEGVVRNGSKIVSKASLQPGTLVAWEPPLREGMQQLRIIAEWPDGETTWMFAVERSTTN